MSAVVIDSSALLRLFVPDGALPEGLEAAVEDTLRGDAELLAPELALAEVAQALRKKEHAGLISPEDADIVLDGVLALPLRVVGHREGIRDAVHFARTTGLTVYDALFLALARKHRAPLITADAALARAADGGCRVDGGDDAK